MCSQYLFDKRVRFHRIDRLNQRSRYFSGGIIICGYKLNDMMYSELHDCLPDSFDMLLMASRRAMNDCLNNDIVCLSMPFKVHDLVDTVSMMGHTIIRRQKKAKQKPKDDLA